MPGNGKDDQCNDVSSPLSVRGAVPVASFRVAAAQPRQPQPCHHVGRKLFASSLPTPSMPEKPGSKRSQFSEQQECSTTFKLHVMYFFSNTKKFPDSSM